MGAKQTKIEGTYLPDTPTLNRMLMRPTISDLEENATNPLDPRSPNVCRTPINMLCSQPATAQELMPQHTPVSISENRLGMLRKRFLKSFTYNLSDPRSPTANLNRTPIVFEDDKALNLDDTFADLFVESKLRIKAATKEETSTVSDEMQVDNEHVARVQYVADGTQKEQHSDINNISSIDIASLTYDEDTMPSQAALQQTPIALQQELDPRSPGLERTPIIFTDDDEANEDAVLENILATLSLNLSNNSSITSFDASNNKAKARTPVLKLANKHLERVSIGNKQRMPMRKTRLSHRQRIYEDNENAMPTTPKQKSLASDSSSAGKRTPLSCVKNRAHLRSRSVETSTKSLKARLPLKSFDDNLNPVQSAKIANLRIIQDHVAEDLLDL